MEGSYEVFVAVGRPGEPINGGLRRQPSQGVDVKRYTTSDFVEWSEPEVVLFLPNGIPPPGSIDNLIQ